MITAVKTYNAYFEVVDDDFIAVALTFTSDSMESAIIPLATVPEDTTVLVMHAGLPQHLRELRSVANQALARYGTGQKAGKILAIRQRAFDGE